MIKNNYYWLIFFFFAVKNKNLKEKIEKKVEIIKKLENCENYSFLKFFEYKSKSKSKR